MKELYTKLEYLERQIKRGYITLAEGNRLMIEAIDSAENVNSLKAYHKMYMILANLTKP